MAKRSKDINDRSLLEVEVNNPEKNSDENEKDKIQNLKELGNTQIPDSISDIFTLEIIGQI